MTDSKRLFIATFLNDDEKEFVANLISANDNLLSSYKPDVRFVSPDKWHLTWMFLGYCQKEIESGILEILEETALSCAVQKIDYDKFLIWPSSREPRVGVLESSFPPVKFVHSVEQMQRRLSAILQNPGEKYAKFRPHISIARFKNRCFDNQDFDTSTLPLVQKIDQVALVESDVKVYNIVEKFSLRQD